MLQDEVKTELVLKGGTRLAFALWKGAGPSARRDCSLVACNLAVGKVGTLSVTGFPSTPVLCLAPDLTPPRSIPFGPSEGEVFDDTKETIAATATA